MSAIASAATKSKMTLLNYDQWHICSHARDLGKKEKMPVFMFLKEPVIRKFGEKFFDALSEIYDSLHII
jgi:hypothetical protein